MFTVIDKNGFTKIKTGIVSSSDLSDSANIPLLNANNHFTGTGNQVFDGNVKPATTQMLSWNTRSDGPVYLAASDGLVVVVFYSTNLINAQNQVSGFSDASTGPTVKRALWTSTVAASSGIGEGFMFPVKKGDYYQVVGVSGIGGSLSITVYWVPLGTAG